MSSIFLSCFSAGRDPGTTAGIIIAVVVVILFAGVAVYYKRKKQMEEADVSREEGSNNYQLDNNYLEETM